MTITFSLVLNPRKSSSLTGHIWVSGIVSKLGADGDIC